MDDTVRRHFSVARLGSSGIHGLDIANDHHADYGLILSIIRAGAAHGVFVATTENLLDSAKQLCVLYKNFNDCRGFAGEEAEFSDGNPDCAAADIGASIFTSSLKSQTRDFTDKLVKLV